MRVLICSILTLLTTSAFAQAEGRVQSDRFRPSFDREAVLDTQSGELPPHLSYDIALWAGFALRPLTVFEQGDIVSEQATTSLNAQIALFDWVALGIHLPLSLYQNGDDQVPGIGANLVQSFGLRDPTLGAKVRLWRGPVDIAFTPSLSVPLSQEGYLGEGDLTLTPELAFSRRFPDVVILANLGFLWRPEKQLLGTTFGSEVVARVAASYRLDRYGVPFGIEGSLKGVTQVAPNILEPGTVGAEALFGMDFVLYDRLQLVVGGGTGLFAAAGIPEFRVFSALRYSPRAGDEDSDGILGRDDLCPKDAEDQDGFEDQDGCPDLDNDKDGINDAFDNCPNSAEDIDAFKDQDGCPDIDNDKDDIEDELDRCRDAAEDYDGFEDQDGCPDLDNDKDGVKDSDDKCPDLKGDVRAQGCAFADADKDGVRDDADRCPEAQEDTDGFEDEDGCPDVDNDRDNIEDQNDKCPNRAEDVDGHADLDGCPEIDADSDGVLDEKDKCKNEQETINGIKDDDGCQDRGEASIEVKNNKVTLLKRFRFAPNSTKILSRKLLGELALHIIAHPELKRVGIDVHTGGAGDSAKNQTLSEKRAATLVDRLVKLGVPSDRLVARGFGDTTPLVPSNTLKGRKKNRRVEVNPLAQKDN